MAAAPIRDTGLDQSEVPAVAARHVDSVPCGWVVGRSQASDVVDAGLA
jgi:hypothetical protein